MIPGTESTPVVPGYRLVRELGAGASAVVWLAVQEQLGREVALKILSAGLFDADETRARFLRETRVQAKLTHPSLLTIFDAGFASERPYLAVEIVTGGSLREWLLSEQPPTLRETLTVGAAIASGLAHAHRRQIVHRDLKPENVLLTGERSVKIADFGLAKALSATEAVQTASGVILGTPGYLGPEVIRGEPAGPPADVYALGVMLFEMIAGARPFEENDLGLLLRRQLQEIPPSVASIVAGVPPELAELVSECLGLEPAQRPAASIAAARLARIDSSDPTVPGGARAPRSASGTVAAAAPSKGVATAIERASSVRRPAAKSVPAPARPTSVTSQPIAARATDSAFPIQRVAMAVLAVLGLAGFAAFSGKGPAPSKAQPSPVSSAASALHDSKALPGSPEAPALPKVRWLTTGLNRAAAWLDGPVPRGLTATYWLDGASERSTVPTTPGARVIQLAGLEPDRAYVTGLWLGAQTLKQGFRTMKRGDGGGPRLNLPGEYARGVRAVARGPWLTVLWRHKTAKRTEVVLSRESPDGGETWGPMQTLSSQGSYASWPEAIATGQGVAAAWAIRKPDGARLEVRVRPEGGEWSEIQSSPGLDHDTCLFETLEGLDMIGWSPMPATRVNGIRWLSLNRTVWKGLERPAVMPLPHSCSSRRCCQAAKIGQNLFLLFTGPEPSKGKEVIWYSAGSRPEAGRWEPARMLTRPDETIAAVPALLAEGGKVLVAYDTGFVMPVRSSTDGGQTFGEPIYPLGENMTGFLPALASDGPTALLAATNFDFMTRTGTLTLLESRDWLHWREAATREVRTGRPYGLALVVSGRKRIAILIGDDDSVSAVTM